MLDPDWRIPYLKKFICNDLKHISLGNSKTRYNVSFLYLVTHLVSANLSLNWMILCSKLKNENRKIWKIVTKSHVVTKFNVTKSRLHCIFKRNVELALSFTFRYTDFSRNPTIYNIIRWFAWTNDSSTKRLMFQALFFFIIS